MITNFERITYDLNDQELEFVDVLISGFKNRSRENPIKAPEIIKKANDHSAERIGIRLTEPRLRKLVNSITEAKASSTNLDACVESNSPVGLGSQHSEDAPPNIPMIRFI